MKKILVTGGAGFIGSNLCEKLLKNGDYVICLDNLYTGRLENIEKILNHPNFEFMQHDIINPINILVDQIYNLACPASPKKYQKSPVMTAKTNILGIINMLELATKCNAEILQFSTSEVYGNPDIHPQAESYFGNVNPIGVRACYDEGKRCAEMLCYDYHREFGTKIKIVRVFNTYGPNMDPKDGRVISNFIMQALKNEPITVYGKGTQSRSFCYIDDLIDGVFLTMNNSDCIGPINIGNPEEITIKELAIFIIKQISSNSDVINCILPKDDPIQRKPDITLAYNELKWKPKVTLIKGIGDTIEYFKKYIS